MGGLFFLMFAGLI
jgi:hypothetical protein